MRSALLAALALGACASPRVREWRAPLAAPTTLELERRLEEAHAARLAAPDRLAAWVWEGRTLAYLGRVEEAQGLYTQALERWPDSAELLRHRGHRWITLRELERAEADLARASELVRGLPDVVEQDGLPNARGIPRSTLASNVEYHLALARYLRGDFTGSLEAWRRCMERASNDDLRVACGHWTYLTLRRLGRAREAEELAHSLADAREVLENHAYAASLRVARGELPPEALLAGAAPDSPATGASRTPSAAAGDAAAVYAAACHLAFRGEAAEARTLLAELAASPSAGSAFGRIAAEVELARGWPPSVSGTHAPAPAPTSMDEERAALARPAPGR